MVTPHTRHLIRCAACCVHCLLGWVATLPLWPADVDVLAPTDHHLHYPSSQGLGSLDRWPFDRWLDEQAPTQPRLQL